MSQANRFHPLLQCAGISLYFLTLAACSGSGEGGPSSSDKNPHFSFFVTSLEGLLGVGAGEWGDAPGPEGFGGDLGGLRGADAICTALARSASPTDAKVWRAFLSTSGVADERVDAIDRIGSGPWYDLRGFKLADDVAGLLPPSDGDGRPRGAEPELAAMFTVETGDRARS